MFDTFEEATLELFPIQEHDVLARNNEPDPKVREEIQKISAEGT